jgi:hypothetical protein
MFCPECGAAEQSMDSYCKRCGEWLPDTKRLGRRHGRLSARTPEQRNRKMRVLEILSAVFALLTGGLIVGVLTGNLDRTVLSLAVNLCTLIMAFQAINFAIGKSLQKRIKQGRDEGERSDKLEQGKSLPQLNEADASLFVQPPSVTESTTALLDPVPRVMEQKK